MTAIPALAQAATERKEAAVSSVLERIRTTHPRSSRIPDAVFAVLIFLTAASVFAIVVFVVWELIDKSTTVVAPIRIGLFLRPRLGSGQRPVRRDAVYLRNAGLVVSGA